MKIKKIAAGGPILGNAGIPSVDNVPAIISDKFTKILYICDVIF